MARPKKFGTDEMLEIVNKYYESCGDTRQLKYSRIEEYAKSVGVDVKAYDFRRDPAVRQRLKELSIEGLSGAGSTAIAYKSLDVDAFLNRCRTKAMLRSSLLELDESWRRVYEYAADLFKNNEELRAKAENVDARFNEVTKENADMTGKVIDANRLNNELLAENRYLKKMLRTYLYPAIANEILKRENVIERCDTDVTRIAMDNLTDLSAPLSFSSSVEADRQAVTHEDGLLARMRSQISGSKSDA